MIIFVLGGLFLLSGMVIYLLEIRLCKKVMEATKHDDDPLTNNDILFSHKFFERRKKLRNVASSDDYSPDLRTSAGKALRYELIVYALFILGMVLMTLQSLWNSAGS